MPRKNPKSTAFLSFGFQPPNNAMKAALSSDARAEAMTKEHI
jgi:hypothetical protein